VLIITNITVQIYVLVEEKIKHEEIALFAILEVFSAELHA
jgi:hypothetical protein